MKGMRMQTSHHIQQAMRKLGTQGMPLTRVYRNLFNESLFLTAYSNIYKNDGALTTGTDENDTLDGMSIERIRNLIELLRNEQYYPRPNRRIQVPKKSGGKRPLGIPNGSEKLVQEAIRLILEAYYEPRFRESSHGFRPEKGCHTALKDIKTHFGSSIWFIEGDIKGCFDNIDHEILLNILKRDIHDNRLIELIERFLKAGYMEDWQYHKTYSGVPQGDVLSPLLSNIYLNELDSFIEDELIPRHNYGKRRRKHPRYKSLSQRIERLRRRGKFEEARAFELERRKYPAIDTQDTSYRRLKYVRYADDWLIGYTGTKEEASQIKEEIRTFLREKLHLELNTEKTLITHGRTEYARFLNYSISLYHADDKLSVRAYDGALVRSVNSKIRLGIPEGLIDEKAKRYYKNGKVVSDATLLQNSVPHILLMYQQRYRGLVQYYKYAADLRNMSKLKYAMEIALVKTLAHKLRIKVSRVYRRYRSTMQVNGRNYRILKTEVDTGKRIQTFYWGAISLKTNKQVFESINDVKRDFEVFQYIEKRSELITRLKADECEICGMKGKCEVHHVRKLANLKQRWQGKRTKPFWVTKMIAMQRKTLIVCQDCHRKIHNGEPLPPTKNA